MAVHKKLGCGCGCKGICGCGKTPKMTAAHPSTREVLMVPEHAWSDEQLPNLPIVPGASYDGADSHLPFEGSSSGESVRLADAGAPIPGGWIR